jgi:hypothetical protein
MATLPTPKSSREKVRAHRQRQRERGLRPVQFWVQDVHAPAFRSEARRQSRAVSGSPHAGDDQAFVDNSSAWGDA